LHSNDATSGLNSLFDTSSATRIVNHAVAPSEIPKASGDAQLNEWLSGELSEHLSDIKALARRRTKGQVVA